MWPVCQTWKIVNVLNTRHYWTIIITGGGVCDFLNNQGHGKFMKPLKVTAEADNTYQDLAD